MTKKSRRDGGLNEDRKRHFIDLVAARLRQGRPTPFCHEASCRHGLRVFLILEGWRWAPADTQAAQIVGAALSLIGAKRPSWYEGQPSSADDGIGPLSTSCMRCGKPIEAQRSRNGIGLRFCSNACRVAIRRTTTKTTVEDYRAAQRAGAEVIRMARLTTCPHCGIEFAPRRNQWPPDPGKPRYCSNSCSKAAYWAKQRARAPTAVFCVAAE